MFKTLKLFFDVTSSFNVDCVRTQSLFSTAVRVVETAQQIRQGAPYEDIEQRIDNTSTYWFNKMKRSALFDNRIVDEIETVTAYANRHGLHFSFREQQFHRDRYCLYAMLVSPFTGKPAVLNLETGTWGNPAQFSKARKGAVVQTLDTEDEPVRLFNYTDGNIVRSVILTGEGPVC